MKTEIIKIVNPASQDADISRIGKAVREGALCAFPTETVYGLGANALDARAVAKIFEAKGRPQDNPLIIHIADAAQLDAYCTDVPDLARAAADAFWPGPLTLILKKRALIPEAVTAGLDSVAIRCPSDLIAQRLIAAAGVPIAAPSANTSGKPSPTTAGHVVEDLNGRIDYIIDGGDCGIGVESTVVDLTVTPPCVLRPGGVSLEQLRHALGNVELYAGHTDAAETDKPRSPGMKYRHYAPRAAVRIIEGTPEQSARNILDMNLVNPGDGILCFDDFKQCFDGYDHVITYGRSDRPDEQAQRLFAALREFDALNVETIFVQMPNDAGLGLAVCNRLMKAAGGSKIAFG